MNEPTIETLTRRVHRVERENRRLYKIGAATLAIIAGVVLTGQVEKHAVPKAIEAESFVVRDARGQLRAILGVWQDGEVRLLMPDQEQRSRAILAVKPDGSPYLGLYDATGKRRIGMAVLQDGMLALGFAHADGKSRAGLSMWPDGSSTMFLADADGKVLWRAP